ncbi:hypothetical protein LINGRAHAP2_LOCUS22962, partial [Linum grandiflorum]
MAQAAKLVNPIRQPMWLFSCWKCCSISQFRQLVDRGFEPANTLLKRLEPSIAPYRCSEFKSKFISTLETFRSLKSAGTVEGIASASFLIASIGRLPAVAHAVHGEEILVDDRESFDASDRDEFAHAAWMVIRKLWLPAYFLVTFVWNWHLCISHITKAVLLLLATRPSPLTVYLFVDQLCHQSVRQQPQAFWEKSLYAEKVEVEDYKLICVATVQVRDKKFSLVGILGGWWVLQLSQETF